MRGLDNKRKKRIFILTVSLFFALALYQAAGASKKADNQTVKAGIFYFDGYHMKDEVGNLAGYGIEVLNLISEYSHLSFEYAGYDKSWNDMLDMLKNGKIDVVTLARKTDELSGQFLFSNPIGINHTVLSVQENDVRFRRGDYKTYDDMLVGMIKGSSQNKTLKEFAKKHHFKYRIKRFENIGALAKALQDGTVDVALSSDLRKTENEKTLDTLDSENFYAIVRKNDTELLEEINYAIEQMNINEGNWASGLFYKYYGSVYSSALEFNKREQAYIQDVVSGKKKITATSLGDRKPYSYLDGGALTGIQVDYFAQIMEMAGLPFEMVAPKDRADYQKITENDSVDVVIDKRTSDVDVNEDSNYGFRTDPYMSTGMAKVTRKDFKGEIQTVAVAKDQGNAPVDLGLVGGAKIKEYETRQEAFQAVLDKEADCVYAYTYSVQMFVNSDVTGSLYYSIIDGIRFEFCMYVRNDSDHELVTILNKCIHQMSQDAMNQLAAEYTSYTPQDMTLVQYVRTNPGVLAAVALLFVAAAAAIAILVLRAGWNRKMLDVAERSKTELESQLAIVEALSRDYINVFAVRAKEAKAKVIKTKGDASDELKLKIGREFEYNSMVNAYIDKNVHPKDRQEIQEAFSLSRMMKKLREVPEYTGTFRTVSEEGTHNFQYTFINMKSDELGGCELILAGIRNIDETVRKEREQNEALAEALAEAQHANHAKTIFLNNMSHDIRTPMNAIIGFTSLAATHIESRDLVSDYLDKIMTSSRHLLSLINDVLDMSRIESGKVRIEEKEASLPQIMHDLKTIVQSDVKAKQLDFYIDTVDVTNENIICDKLRLNQVLLNILSNAMKYTKPGGMVSVRIIQTKDTEDGYASYQFKIKDTGIGMSQKFLDHLFEPFEREQTSTVSGIQGTGLGLAITKNIVDMMNGTIHVESEEGKGSEFTVSFRFRIAGELAQAAPVKELMDLRALIVDDDMNTCMSVSKMLSSIGMRPDWTTQGKEAVARCGFALEQNEPYSTYIIDWLMPDMNGIEIVRRIRKMIGDIPNIIILTAYDWSDVEQEAKEAGVTAFCSKPIFLSELRAALTAPITAKEEAEAPDTAVESFLGKKILLVEDNEINQEIAKAILEEAGFVIDIADDGTVAVDKMEGAKQDTYDLILMDIQMSRMNGYDATRAIRAMQDPVKSKIPIVAMTANAFEEDKQLALDAGMNGHVAKPIEVEKLMETLIDILSKKNGRRQAGL